MSDIEEALADVEEHVCRGGAWCHSDTLKAEVARLRAELDAEEGT